MGLFDEKAVVYNHSTWVISVHILFYMLIFVNNQLAKRNLLSSHSNKFDNPFHPVRTFT
jgi:hypothetical protein